MKRPLLAALFAVAAVTAAAPLPSLAASNVSVFIGAAPPAPLYEPAPPPRAGYAWAPGHWGWNGYRHAWAPGYWVAARPGYVYQAPSWYARDGGWVLEPARWSRHDRDGDGIPDRYEMRRDDRPYYGGRSDYYDARPAWREREHERYERQRRWDEDRDGVPNRYDRDRDGDGVPNRWDRRPDNPWRR